MSPPLLSMPSTVGTENDLEIVGGFFSAIVADSCSSFYPITPLFLKTAPKFVLEGGGFAFNRP